MTQAPRLHFQRYEFKYHLPTATAQKLIPALLNHMSWDRHAQGDENKSYPVHSVYYDSFDLRAYWDKVDGEERRKKLRVRTYTPDDQQAPFFLEIKRKHGSVVMKDRIVVSPDRGREMLRSRRLGGDPGAPVDPVAEEFVADLNLYNLKPKVLVAYRRMPLVGRFEDNLRVTFDYDLRAGRVYSLDFTAPTKPMYPGHLIVEVKFNNLLPYWMHSIIQAFGLFEQRYSKYCSGIDTSFQTIDGLVC